MGNVSEKIIEEEQELNNINLIKSPLKWAGGKRNLLKELIKFVPKNYNKYIEPFLGGGALFFYLNPKKSIVSDLNLDLMNFYEVLKCNYKELLAILEKYKDGNNKEFYYKTRNIDRKVEFKKLNKIEKAARFLYLNKSCYNGLYRVNSKGEFNVPFGTYKNITLYEEVNLYNASLTLQNSEIFTADFESILNKFAKKNDFVYLDPPYVPINGTANFTNYTKENFGPKDQVRLKFLCDDLHRRGVKFMLSNSSHSIVYELYRDYKLYEINAKRYINSNSLKRGNIKELVITNY